MVLLIQDLVMIAYPATEAVLQTRLLPAQERQNGRFANSSSRRYGAFAWPFSQAQGIGMKLNMAVDKAGDKIIAVVVARAHIELNIQTVLLSGGHKFFGL